MTPTRRKFTALVTVAAVLLAAVVALWPSPNALARYHVRSVLRSDSAAAEQLRDLEPFVKVGDSITTVRSKLSPTPRAAGPIRRPTEWALGLGDTNLVLAIAKSGEVVGIGRHRHGEDDGTVWLSQPTW